MVSTVGSRVASGEKTQRGRGDATGSGDSRPVGLAISSVARPVSQGQSG